MIKIYIQHRRTYFNNPDAKGFIVYGVKDRSIVFEFGRGSSLDHEFKTRKQAELFAQHIDPEFECIDRGIL